MLNYNNLFKVVLIVYMNFDGSKVREVIMVFVSFVHTKSFYGPKYLISKMASANHMVKKRNLFKRYVRKF